jgi:lycopene beta-cyclase
MYNDRVVNMGTMGGLTKPSTGYTFTRIHRHCASIVSRLEQGHQPVVEGESQYRFRVYDTMLLYILEHQPAMGKQIFHDLFQRNHYDRVLTFLEEKTHPLQELAIFATLPYAPFLRSIWKMRRHILTGA